MLCESAEVLLVDYQRHSLAAVEHAALTAHLQQCEHCSKQLAALQQLNQLLDREQQPSPQARTRFIVQLQQEAARGAVSRDARIGLVPWLQQWWSSRPLGAFSYSAALLVAGMLSGQLLPPDLLGIGSQQAASQSTDRQIQLCPVPPSPENAVI